MNNNQSPQTEPNSNRALFFVSWLLSLLFIIKSLNFFFSINLEAESGLNPDLLVAIFFTISGTAMLLLAWGVIKKNRWVRTSLYVVFLANTLLLVYSIFVVQNWIDAGMSLVGAVLLYSYLSQTKNIYQGRRLVILQILTIFTLLPATIFMLLTVLFQDEALQDDSALRLKAAPQIEAVGNLYSTLTTLGTELPGSAKQANQMVSTYPSQWDKTNANLILKTLQPFVDTYLIAANQDDYQCPTSINNFRMEAEMCKLNLVRNYAQIMQFAAITEAERGNIALAQDYALASTRVGNTMVQAENVTLIEYLVGLASINIGLDTLDALNEQKLLNRVTIVSPLQNAVIPIESLSIPLQREYLGQRISLDESIDLPQTYIYHPNRTRNELFTFMNQVKENSITSCVVNNEESLSASEVDLVAYLENLRANVLNPVQPNLIGRIYLSVVLGSLNNTKDTVCATNERIAEYTD